MATNNLPFSLMDVLTPLCKDIFPDSKIARELALHRTKATHIVKESISKIYCGELYEKLRENGSFFSIIMDETTDNSTTKHCAFTVIYFDHQQYKIICRFFDMVEHCSGTADDLYKCLVKTISEKRIPLTNLVGFSSDTTNCMFGKDQSVAALLKKEFPDIALIKCSCHMIHLCASKACLELPRSVEDLLRNIGAHFHRSAKRTEKFKEFQDFFGTEIHKIISPSNTRWLSLKACVDRVLEQFVPLHMYFREYILSDPSKTTDEMLNIMNNKFTIIYLEFMSYVLGLLVDFNILFQGESSLLHKLKPETERLLKIIYSNFLELKYFKNEDIFSINHSNPQHFLPLQKVYVGIAGNESLQELKNQNVDINELEQFYKTCLKFYIALASQIKEKFKFDDQVFEIISLLEPSEAQAFHIKTLQKCFHRFPILKQHLKLQEVDDEWRQHALLNHSDHGLNTNLAAEEYWKKVFLLKNAAGILLFPNLRKVIIYLLILPFSNASVERIFSELNNIKTFHRNNLSSDTISALIFSKQGINNEGGILKFNPSQKMIDCNIWKKATD